MKINAYVYFSDFFGGCIMVTKIYLKNNRGKKKTKNRINLHIIGIY